MTDPDGRRTGRMSDVIVGLGDGPYPPLTGLVVTVSGKDRFAHMHDVAALAHDGVRLSTRAETLGPFERRPGEVLLVKDVAGRHLIHLKGARLVRANEIELACVSGRWVVIGVDPSSRPMMRRLLPRSARDRVEAGGLVDWAEIEPFVAHVPTARLRIPLRQLARLHPAQLADLVEAASHEEGAEIIAAVGGDRELEADVFEELDMEHQVEFLRSRSDEQVARVLTAMAPDDAVDLLEELDQERRLPILQLLPAVPQRKLRSLLSYNPETAGGLMNPDFVSVVLPATAAEALDTVKASKVAPQAAGVVLVTDPVGQLLGTVLVVELLRADPAAAVDTVTRLEPVALTPDADVHEVSRAMSDYNLAVLPVVDEQGAPLGLISVDDVLERLLPDGWRRQYGMSSATG
ncbi:MAG: magnesium transporter [Acidobacteriota bacterium]|nr:magnesium transporter [Acidobacteriota bacterium]